MKLVLLMYLEDDEPVVERLLEEVRIRSFSRLPMEGRGKGRPGWYGEIAPYHSSMVFAVVPDEQAEALGLAVEGLGDVTDERHPIHHVQLGVEKCICSGGATPPFLNV